MQREGTLYTIIFAAAVCGVCSILVSGAAVGLKERQKANQILFKQRNVLYLTGLAKAGEKLPADKTQKMFADSIVPKIVDLATGDYVDNVDTATFDQRRMAKDPATSKPAPENTAGITSLPNQAIVYLVMKDGKIDQIVLPIEGRGLWSVMYGYLSLDKDTTTIRGISFYEHGETPGLGGEIENPRWQAKWVSRKGYDEQWKPAIKVIKGQAGSPEQDPHQIDGLSGATLTSRGVQHTVDFWLDDSGFGPYLKKIREQGSV